MTKKTHLQIRLSEDEKGRLIELADQKRLTLSAYAREKLLGGAIDPKPPAGDRIQTKGPKTPQALGWNREANRLHS